MPAKKRDYRRIRTSLKEFIKTQPEILATFTPRTQMIVAGSVVGLTRRVIAKAFDTTASSIGRRLSYTEYRAWALVELFHLRSTWLEKLRHTTKMLEKQRPNWRVLGLGEQRYLEKVLPLAAGAVDDLGMVGLTELASRLRRISDQVVERHRSFQQILDAIAEQPNRFTSLEKSVFDLASGADGSHSRSMAEIGRIHGFSRENSRRVFRQLRRKAGIASHGR